MSTLTPYSHRLCHHIVHGTLPGSDHICSRVYSDYCCCIDKNDLYDTHTAARGRRLKGAKQEQRRRPSSLLPKLLKQEIMMDRILRAVVMVVVKKSAAFLFVPTNLSPVRRIRLCCRLQSIKKCQLVKICNGNAAGSQKNVLVGRGERKAHATWLYKT